tara:strand:+ start:4613 stop:4906 length:294 start_codon:yes stop_codon:yes gene_type:complete
VSFCLGEFGLSFDYLYTMTMAEFNIRYFALNRIEEKNDLRTREISYSSLTGSHLDPKKLPKNKKEYWSIGADNIIEKGRIDKMKQAILKAQQDYNTK